MVGISSFKSLDKAKICFEKWEWKSTFSRISVLVSFGF